MDQAALDVIRLFWNAFAAERVTLERVSGRWGDRLLANFYAPDAVFDLSAIPGWPGQPRYEGHAGIRQFWTEWFGAWDAVDWRTERIEPVGDAILVVAKQNVNATSSRPPAEWGVAFLGTCRDSKITLARFFPDEGAARRAAQGELPPEPLLAVSHGESPAWSD